MCSSPVIDSRHRITSRNKAQLIPDAIFARSSYIKDKMVSCLLDSKYYLYRLLVMADPEIQRLQIGGLGSKRHVNEGIHGQRILGSYQKLASLMAMLARQVRREEAFKHMPRITDNKTIYRRSQAALFYSISHSRRGRVNLKQI